MNTVEPFPGCKIRLSDDYQKTILPGLNAWVAALKSGEYKQGRETLAYNRDGEMAYCCLGVLSQIQGRLTKIEVPGIIHDYYIDGPDLPPNGKAAGILAESNPMTPIIGGFGSFPKGAMVYIAGKPEPYSLTMLNDTCRLNFEQIAIVLETLYYEP